jgi:hypothetical protein
MLVVGCLSNCNLTEEGRFPLLLLLPPLLLLPLDRRKRPGLRSGNVTTAEAGMPVPVVTVCSPRVSMPEYELKQLVGRDTTSTDCGVNSSSVATLRGWRLSLCVCALMRACEYAAFGLLR